MFFRVPLVLLLDLDLLVDRLLNGKLIVPQRTTGLAAPNHHELTEGRRKRPSDIIEDLLNILCLILYIEFRFVVFLLDVLFYLIGVILVLVRQRVVGWSCTPATDLV